MTRKECNKPNYETMNYAARRAAIELSKGSRKTQLNRIYERDHGICQLCMKLCSREDASREHLIGPFEGFTPEQFNNDLNVILAHSLCNNQKAQKPSSKVRTVKESKGRHLRTTIAEAFPDFPWKEWTDGLTSESD